jgi:hypothetical protein
MDGSSVGVQTQRDFVLPVADGAEVSLVNPGVSAVNYTLSFVSNAGTTQGSVQGRIPAFGRTAVLSDVIRPQGASGGYLRGSSGGVVPFEVFGNMIWTAALDASEAYPETAATLQYGPQFVSGGGYQSILDLINLELGPSTLTATWIGDSGQTIGQLASINLPAGGAAHLTGPATFGISGSELIQGYVRIQSNRMRFAGAVRFTDPQQRVFGSALKLSAVVQTDSYFSQVAQDPQYYTGLAAINPGTRMAAVTISVYDTEGRLVASGTTQIPAGCRFSKLLTELVGAFPAMSKGYFKVHSTEPLISFALFGTWDGSVLSAIPAQYPTGK